MRFAGGERNSKRLARREQMPLPITSSIVFGRKRSASGVAGFVVVKRSVMGMRGAQQGALSGA
jgi:hypothetical protein